MSALSRLPLPWSSLVMVAGTYPAGLLGATLISPSLAPLRRAGEGGLDQCGGPGHREALPEVSQERSLCGSVARAVCPAGEVRRGASGLCS